MPPRYPLRLGAGLVSALTACGPDPSTHSTEGDLGTISQSTVSYGANAVTALDPADPVFRTSSTSTIVKTYNNASAAIVAFNLDFSNDGFTYTSTTETVCPGRTHVGYAWSNGPPSMTTSFAPADSLTPDAFITYPQWPVFLGSPSIGQLPNTPYWYVTTLAIPQVNMPKGGGCVTGNAASLSGGACVVTFTGIPTNFAIVNDNCLTNGGSPYDVWNSTEVVGSAPPPKSMPTPNNTVYAAFGNPTRNEIDLFAATSPTGPFVQLPNPFPGLTITDAPKMVDNNNGVYLAAADVNNTIWLTSCSAAGGCSSPSQVTTAYYPTVGGRPSYDVGGVYQNNGEVRVAYTAHDPSNVGFSCVNVASCTPVRFGLACNPNAFTICPSLRVRSPAIAMPWAPVEGVPAWKVAWLQGIFSFDVYSADLGISPGQVTQIRHEAGTTSLCGRNALYGYNEHLGVYQPSTTVDPQFVYAFPDSTSPDGGPSSCTSWAYWSSPFFTSATYLLYP